MTATPVAAATRDELLGRAVALGEVLRARAAQTEELGRIPAETVDALFASQLTRISIPARFGGLDVGYDLMLSVGIELARACAATGWCFTLWGAHAWVIGHWPIQAQQEVYGGGTEVLCSASFAPGGGTCVPSERGEFRLNGHWEFASGCDAAAWLILGARGPDGQLLWVLVPRSDYEIVQDSWNVSGLSGTGSKDIIVRNAFVPEHRVLDPRPAFVGQGHGPALHHQPQYHMPVRVLLIWDLVAPMVGMALGAIDEFTARLHGKTGPGRTGDSGALLARLAKSSAEVDAAWALLRQDIRETFDKAERNEPFSIVDRGRYHRDKAYVASVCLQAVNRLFDVSGGHALFKSDAMQRWHRDVNAASHRDMLVLDFGGQAYARLALGLPIDGLPPI